MAYGDIRDNVKGNDSFSFQLGHVENVFTSEYEFQPIETSSPDVNLIEFTPYTSATTRKPVLTAIPLLRGISDSIARGDLILFTTIGRKTFYLGPINTKNNPSNSADHTYDPKKGLKTFFTDRLKDRADGYNINMPSITVPKLSKPRHNTLDYPGLFEEINPTSIEYAESNFSDLTLEGRYGNAIRVGARNQFPQLIISNNNTRKIETLLGGGSIFAMTSIGTIVDNFPLDGGFSLSCDFGDNILPERNPRNVFINSGNDKTADDHTSEDVFNYRFGEIKPLDGDETQTEFDQIIISSDRIIFNSTAEDVSLSSNRNINFGAGGNFTVSNKGYSVFESRNIYIGNRAKQRQQPMVLGEELRRLLTKILGLLANAQALGDYNVPQPLSVSPQVAMAGSLKMEVDKIMREFNLGNYFDPDTLAGYTPNVEEGKPTGDKITGHATFMSQHHFIEPNR